MQEDDLMSYLVKTTIYGRPGTAVRRLLAFPAILLANEMQKFMPPDCFFDYMMRDKGTHYDKLGDATVVGMKPFHTGTVFVVGDENKPLGSMVEIYFDYWGVEKRVIYEVDIEDRPRVNEMITCDQGFHPISGTPTIRLFDADTNTEILRPEHIEKVDTISLKLNAKKRRFTIEKRGMGKFGQVGDKEKVIYVAETATIGLFGRVFEGNFQQYDNREVVGVMASENSDILRGVLFFDGPQKSQK